MRILSVILFIISLPAIIWWYTTCLPIDQQNIFNFVTLISGHITIWGFGITIFQLYKVKNVSTATQEAVIKAKEKWDYIQLLNEVSQSILTIQLIKEYAENNKLPIAREKLCDIKNFFIDLKYAKNAIPEGLKTKYNQLCRRINTDINNLNTPDRLQLDVFYNNMEDTISLLKHIENNIKNQYNGQ